MAERRADARPKRKRDAAATREAIMEAATRRFATQGFERAGAREIAADAGVTAALVNRYFGSKEGLFAEVIKRALDMGQLLQGERTDLADHLARVVVSGGKETPDGLLTPLLLLLHSAAEPRAIELFRQDLDRTQLRLLAEQIGGDDAGVRAAMVLAQLTGFAILHRVLRPEAFADARNEELVALLSKGLAACIGQGDAGPVRPPLDVEEPAGRAGRPGRDGGTG
jgi:AcrR family transcriptional regulator